MKPRLAYEALVSCYRHLWYLTPSVVVICLCENDLEEEEKTRVTMAMELFSKERREIKVGKPTFLLVDWAGLGEGERPSLDSFITSDSWLIFNSLGLHGCQELC